MPGHVDIYSTQTISIIIILILIIIIIKHNNHRPDNVVTNINVERTYDGHIILSDLHPYVNPFLTNIHLNRAKYIKG